MGFLPCALSEWPFLRIRLLRSRLGVWLVLLLVVVLRLDRTAAIRDPLAAVLLVASAGAALCVAYLAGARGDRLALRLALPHPRFGGCRNGGALARCRSWSHRPGARRLHPRRLGHYHRRRGDGGDDERLDARPCVRWRQRVGRRVADLGGARRRGLT